MIIKYIVISLLNSQILSNIYYPISAVHMYMYKYTYMYFNHDKTCVFPPFSALIQIIQNVQSKWKTITSTKHIKSSALSTSVFENIKSNFKS